MAFFFEVLIGGLLSGVMYSLVAPAWWVIVALLGGGFLTFWLGLAVFDRSSEDIGELL